jgi:hypothetical protein
MKSMTCTQLGGACEQVFSGETFDDSAAQSQQHGKRSLAIWILGWLHAKQSSKFFNLFGL